MDKDEISAFLKGITLFQGIPDKDFEKIADKFSAQKYNAGEIILLENTVAEALYIIVNGTVDVLKKSLDSGTNEEFLI